MTYNHWTTPVMAKPTSSTTNARGNSKKKETVMASKVVPPRNEIIRRNPQEASDRDCDCTVRTMASSSAAKRAIDRSSKSQVAAAIAENDSKKKTNERNQHSSSSSSSSSNQVRGRTIRFASNVVVSKPSNKQKIYKRKQSEVSSVSSGESSSNPNCNSERWWTKTELKAIQESCIVAVKTRDFMSSLLPAVASTNGGAVAVVGDSMLDRFSERNRKRRKIVRWQMYETTKAIREYESATSTKAPPELLSELLRQYSKPMEMEAIESALKVRMGDDDSLLLDTTIPSSVRKFDAPWCSQRSIEASSPNGGTDR
jgi:hypothetical protein